MDLAFKVVMTWFTTLVMFAMGGIGVGMVIDIGWKATPILLVAMAGVGVFGYLCLAIWRD